MKFEWRSGGEGLLIREDEFSWQGAIESDQRFFLRRSKVRLVEVTDLLLGFLDDETAAKFLAVFVISSGGMHRADSGLFRLEFRFPMKPGCTDYRSDDYFRRLAHIVDIFSAQLGLSTVKTSVSVAGRELIYACDFLEH